MSAARRSVAVCVGALVALVVLVAGATPAWAHAELLGVDPTTGAVLEQAPNRVVLRFSENVDPVSGQVRLVRGDGTEMSGIEVGRENGDRSTVTVGLPDDLADAGYVVSFRVVSADSHLVRGATTFTVGAAGAGVQPGLIERLLTREGGPGTAGVVLAVGRWVSYVGLAVGLGVAAMAALGVGDVRGRAERRLVRAGLWAGAGGAVVMIAGQAATTRGDLSALFTPAAWGDVLSTRSGSWWGARVAVLALLAVVAPVVLTRMRSRAMAFGGVVVGGAALLVVALGGHGATGRAPLLGVVATVLHLAAMSAWIGGLVAVAVVARRSGAGAALTAARRFSPLALLSVAALALSGLANGWRQVGEAGLLTSTDYGRVLLVKVVLVALAVGVGGISRGLVRRSVVPVDAEDPLVLAHSVGAAASSARPDSDSDSDLGSDSGGPRLRRAVSAELGWIAAVLVATVLLVNIRPAIAERTEPATATVVEGERTVQVTVDPAQTGGAAVHVYLFSTRGTLDRATEITVRAALPERDIAMLELPLLPAGPNHVTAPDVNLPLPGLWTIEVDARFGEFDQQSFTADLRIR